MKQESRSEAQRKSLRSPRFIAALATILVLFSLGVSVPAVSSQVAIASSDIWMFTGACVVSLSTASVAYHRFGSSDTRYLLVAVVETFVYVASLMTLIYRSRPDSVMWLPYALVAALNGTIAEQRTSLRAAIIVPPVCLGIAYLTLQNNPVGCGIALVAGSFAVLTFETQAVTAARLDAKAKAYESAERELAELRLVRDRERIARDLHDGIGADLAAIALRAERLLGQPSADADELRSIATRATEGMDDLRTAVWALSKPERTFDEVVDYVRARACDLATPTTEVSVTVEPCEKTLSGEDAAHIQRIVDEAVRNAIRHAKATRVEVRLSGRPLSIEIEDDGKVAMKTVGRRSGLAHMETRAKALSAVLHVTFGAGPLGGTRLAIVQK